MPGRRRKLPSRGELDLWQAAMRDVRPLRSRRPPKPALPAAPPSTPAASPPATPTPAPPTSRKPAAAPAPLDLPKIGGHRAPGLDKSSAEKLKRGRYAIEARIDLHGMTQDEAHRALNGFIARASHDELRCVLVITGKGLRQLDEGGDLGVLRHAVPRWLNEPPTRARILAFGPAQPRHGGGGALYVLLRRRR